MSRRWSMKYIFHTSGRFSSSIFDVSKCLVKSDLIVFAFFIYCFSFFIYCFFIFHVASKTCLRFYLRLRHVFNWKKIFCKPENTFVIGETRTRDLLHHKRELYLWANDAIVMNRPFFNYFILSTKRIKWSKKLPIRSSKVNMFDSRIKMQ